MRAPSRNCLMMSCCSFWGQRGRCFSSCAGLQAPSATLSTHKVCRRAWSSSSPPSAHLCHGLGLVAVAGTSEDGSPDVPPAERGRVLQPAEQAVGTLPCLGENDATRGAMGLEVLLQDLLQLAQLGVLVALVPSERLQARPVLCGGEQSIKGAPRAPKQPAPTLSRSFRYPQRCR